MAATMLEKFGDWQAALDQIVCNASKCNVIKDFSACTADTDRICFVRNLNLFRTVPWIDTYLKNCHNLKRKSKSNSIKYRHEGNKYFQLKNYSKALELYSKSLLYAPCDADGDMSEFSIAVANRSAALFNIDRYKECLEDITRSLLSGYPSHLKYKLFLRKANCLIQLGLAVDDIEAVLALTEEALEKASEINIKKREIHKKEIASLRERISQPRNRVADDNTLADDVPHLLHGSNSVMTQASSAVCWKCNKDQGRHLVATQEIKAGDTLIVEKPFAAVLLPDHYGNHCHHCYMKIIAPIPCDYCCTVGYCSHTCKEESWTTYHSVECRYLDLLHSVGIAHLSLRITLTAGLNNLNEFQQNQLDVSSSLIPGLTVSGHYEQNYPSVFHLMSHTEDMLAEDLLQYTMTAALLLRVLEHSGWFSKEDESNTSNCEYGGSSVPENTADITQHEFLRAASICDGERIGADSTSENKREISKLPNALSPALSEARVYVGGLLLRQIQQLVCNAHAITELQVSQVDDSSLVDMNSQVRVATAIYPAASLINHSCDPTIISSFQKDTLVVKAVKSVPIGGEIFNCYGPHYKRMNRQDRQQALREQYFFTCACQPCTEETQDNDIFQSFKCPSCSEAINIQGPVVICTECSTKMQSHSLLSQQDEAKTLFIQGLKALENSDVKGAITVIRKCYHIREKILYKHHRDLAESEDILARCYAMTGNYKDAGMYLEFSVKSTEAYYGEDSIEVAHELHKYAEVLFNGKQATEALRIIKRAETLYTLHYGKSHEVITELQTMQSCLVQYLSDNSSNS